MNLAFHASNSQNYLLLFAGFITMTYGYWLIGEAEKQARKRRS